MAIGRVWPTASGDRVTGYDPAAWHFLLQSAAASSGPLAGLLFIGLMPNIDKTLKYDKLVKYRPGGHAGP